MSDQETGKEKEDIEVEEGENDSKSDEGIISDHEESHKDVGEDADHKRDRSKDRSRDKRRDRSRDRSRERDRSRDRSRSRRRDRSRNRGRSRSRDRDRYADRGYRGRNEGGRVGGSSRYWGMDKRTEERFHRRREREASKEREKEVIQSSYYGSDVKKNQNDSKKENQDARENRSDERKRSDGVDDKENPEVIPVKQKRVVDMLTSKTGGAYIPPAKLRLMQAEITDKSGAAYQRIAWEALKKSIHGYINKVNISNIGPITRDLLRENIVRGRGLLARSIIQAQAASLTFTNVYAALVAVINSKFPNIGELLLRRLALQFKRGFKRNDKVLCISSATFIAHLTNQCVAHEILILEILTVLVNNPTDDSIEVAIAVLKECGMKLTQVSRKGIEAIFEMLRNILHEGQLDKRVQYMIEVMFQIRKDGFKDFESVNSELDLVEEEDQITHVIQLDEKIDGQEILNVFKFDAEYEVNEDKYKELSKEILNTDDDDSDGEGGSEDGSDGDSDEENSDQEVAEDKGLIIDNTETNLTSLRRTIYLTIHSSLDFEECAHKLLKMQLKPGQEIELCHMFLDCCAEMRTYEKFFGLLAGRFCAINKIYVTPFEQIFRDSYDTIHRLDTNRLRNVGKFFAHLLMTDSISWAVLSHIKLNEDDTTSSSRVFIKILFQELSEYMGLGKLNGKLKDEELQPAFSGLFPKDNPRDTRFAINFFTSIGLGGLTDDLREHLKNRPKTVPEPPVVVKQEKPSSSESSSSSSGSSSSSSSSDSSSSSESSEEEGKKKKKKNEKKKIKASKKKLSDKNKEERSEKNDSRDRRSKNKEEKENEKQNSKDRRTDREERKGRKEARKSEQEGEFDHEQHNDKRKGRKEARKSEQEGEFDHEQHNDKRKGRKEARKSEQEGEVDHEQHNDKHRRREKNSEREHSDVKDRRPNDRHGKENRERDRHDEHPKRREYSDAHELDDKRRHDESHERDSRRKFSENQDSYNRGKRDRQHESDNRRKYDDEIDTRENYDGNHETEKRIKSDEKYGTDSKRKYKDDDGTYRRKKNEEDREAEKRRKYDESPKSDKRKQYDVDHTENSRRRHDEEYESERKRKYNEKSDPEKRKKYDESQEIDTTENYDEIQGIDRRREDDDIHETDVRKKSRGKENSSHRDHERKHRSKRRDRD